MGTRKRILTKDEALSTLERVTMAFASTLADGLARYGYSVDTDCVEDPDTEGEFISFDVILLHPTDEPRRDAGDCIGWNVTIFEEGFKRRESTPGLYSPIITAHPVPANDHEWDMMHPMWLTLRPPYELPSETIRRYTLRAEWLSRKATIAWWESEYKHIRPGTIKPGREIGTYHLHIEKTGTLAEIWEVIGER